MLFITSPINMSFLLLLLLLILVDIFYYYYYFLRIKSKQIINWTNFGYNSHKKKKIKKTIYFENLTIKLYDLYVLNTHIKFCVNKMLFTIQFKNLFFIHNFIL